MGRVRISLKMTFNEILPMVFTTLEHEDIPLAFVGAMALKAYGYHRATQDFDFVAPKGRQDKIVHLLEMLGFETINAVPAFSNHFHDYHLIRIDFIYVSGDTEKAIFRSATKTLSLFGYDIKVVSVEHLVAMKIFAAKSNPDRRLKDLADVQALLRLGQVDEDTIKKYLLKHDLMEFWHVIKLQ